MKNRSDNEWDSTEYEIYTKYDNEQLQDFSSNEPFKKEKKKSNAKLIKIIAAAVLVVAVVLGLFFIKDYIGEFFERGEPPQSNISNNQNSSSVRVTFPEGWTIHQMAQLLEDKKVCSAADFLQAANTPVEGLEIEASEDCVFLLEGYLFPDTYDFYVNESASSVVKRFVSNYKSKVTPEIEQKAKALGYTMHEMLTLASIIQKECDADISECRNVSSVFHNRLDNSKESYLGSDVTYFYLKNMADYLGGSESETFDAFLELYYTYSPYRKGLPVGPICNPGIKAIQAAITPSETDYLYFLTDKSGENFYYAITYEKHQQNAKEAGLN